MIINYYGVSCFKIQSGETTITIDPPSKESGLKAPRFYSDIGISSHSHPRHNGLNELKEKSPEIFLITGPGEYEIKGIRINGFKSFHDASSGEKYGLNTIYTLDIEGVKICHLGDLGEEKIQPQIKEHLGNINILFIPIGGNAVLDSSKSAEIINDFEPNIIVPMHYENDKILKEFLKEFKEEAVKPIDKLTVKKKDILEEKMKVVVLEPNMK